MTTCKSCNTEVALNYCPSCGQAASLKRIDGHYIVHEIEHVLHFDKGILYTIRELALRPGRNIRAFIAEDRSRLVKPVIFVIVASLIYTLVSHFVHAKPLVPGNVDGHSTVMKIFKWTEDHMGYANMIMGAFIALWLKLFFRKHPYNFFEIVIMLCFTVGFAMLIYTLFTAVQGLLHTDLTTIASLASVVYCSWAIGQFFDPTKASSYIKAFAAYMLGMITCGALAGIIGMMIDGMIKH